MKTVNFTVPAIEALPFPEKGRVRYQDSQRPNLVLAVTTKAKTFYLLARRAGVLHETRIGAHPHFKPAEARAKVDEMLGAIERGEDPQDVKGRRRSDVDTLARTFIWWLDTHAKVQLKPRTWRAAETLFERYIRRQLGDRQLHRIGRAELAELHASIIAGVKDRKRHADLTRYTGVHSANEAISLVGNVIRYAINMERFKGPDPTASTNLPRVEPRDRVLHPHEVGPLLAALDEATPTVRDIAKLVLFTGARPINVMAMRWDELDLEHANTWRIPKTKNGQPQVIPLEDLELVILRPRESGPSGRGKSEWVFPARHMGRSGRPATHTTTIHDAWQVVREAAGLSDFRLYDLRSSFGSWQLHHGVDLKVVSVGLGHQNADVTEKHYARLLNQEPIREGKRVAQRAIAEAARSV